MPKPVKTGPSSSWSAVRSSSGMAERLPGDVLATGHPALPDAPVASVSLSDHQ
jgi:hypothetical protein